MAAWRPSSIGVAFFSFFATLPGLAGSERRQCGVRCLVCPCTSAEDSRNRPTCSQNIRRDSLRGETAWPASQSEAQPPLEFVCGRLCPTVALAHLSLLLPFLPAQLSALPLCLSSFPPLPRSYPQLLSRASLPIVSELYGSIFPSPVYPFSCKFGPTL